MSFLPASMNRIRSRTTEKKTATQFSQYKSMRIFPDTQGQLTPVVISSQISNSHACHCYLQVWKGTDEKQLRKSEDTVFPFITLSFTMETSDLSWSNFKIIKALMYVIFTCKIEKDLIKNSREKVETSFIPLKAYANFSDFQGQLTPQSVVRASRNSKSSELSCM